MADETVQPEEPQTDKRSADIGIVCSVRAEIEPLLNRLDRTRKYVDDGATFRGGFLEESLRVAIVEAGSGFARHRKLTRTLIEEHRPQWVISVGFSSPLSAELKSGYVCAASEICDTHGNELPVKCPIPESKRILVRRHVVADQHPAAASDRQPLAAKHMAFAVDTTSLAVAQACQPVSEEDRLTKFISIRGILGDLNEDVTEKPLAAYFEPNDAQKQKMLQSLWARFRPDPELIPWKARAEETAINMNKLLLSVIEQLAQKIRSVI